MASIDLNLIDNHYAQCWDSKGEALKWQLGPVEQLPSGFHVLVFSPTERRKMWTYATCGMSQQGNVTPIELHLFAPSQDESLVELLTVVAHYHLTGACLNVGHSVNFGRPWLPRSKCDYGLVSLPYLDGPNLEWLKLGARDIRFLWLIPITVKEVDFKKSNGETGGKLGVRQEWR